MDFEIDNNQIYSYISIKNNSIFVMKFSFFCIAGRVLLSKRNQYVKVEIMVYIYSFCNVIYDFWFITTLAPHKKYTSIKQE